MTWQAISGRPNPGEPWVGDFLVRIERGTWEQGLGRGVPVHYEHTVGDGRGEAGECRCTMSKQSGTAAAPGERRDRYTVSKKWLSSM